MEFNPFAPTSAPRSAPEKSRRPEDLAEIRRRQLALGTAWKVREIGGKASLAKRSPKIDAADAGFLADRQKAQGLKKSEEVVWAEWMFLEGADSEGTVRKGKGPRWFGDSVTAYMPHESDDQLRGTDALLLFLDEENEREGYPVAVDITTNPGEIDTKVSRDLQRLDVRNPRPSFAYWVDTQADEVGDYFDEPQEGKIATVNTSVYIPKDIIKRFRDEAISAGEADKMMTVLGPYVLRQMKAELEMQALMLLGEVSVESSRKVSTRLSRTEFIEFLRLETPPSLPPALQGSWTIVVHALQSIYGALETLNEKRAQNSMPLSRSFLGDLENSLPSFVRKMEQEVFASEMLLSKTG